MSYGLTKVQEAAILAGPTRLATALRILQYVAKSKNGATCHEACTALGIAHQNGSGRYSELVWSGCLEPTGEKRIALSNLAKVHRVAQDADFKRYIAGRFDKSPAALDDQILKAGKAFLSGTKKAKTLAAKTKVAVRLVQEMSRLANHTTKESKSK